MTSTSLCPIPYKQVHVLPNGAFRECCSTHNQIKKNHISLVDWWYKDPDLNAFRQELLGPSLPKKCSSCDLQEKSLGTSFRIEVLKQAPLVNNDITFPNRWHICFGNTCNLGCWTCDETSSSYIESQKRKLNILPDSFIDVNESFNQRWNSTIFPGIKESYKHHEIINISILGGEPSYNNTVISFLNYLVENNLNSRTRIELTTNGSRSFQKIIPLLNKDLWNHISLFVSVDAIGSKSNWLRYGGDWNIIDNNINQLNKIAHYSEIQCTVSVLNIADIINVYDYSKEKQINFSINPVQNPPIMNIKHWDGDNFIQELLPEFESRNLQDYYYSFKSEPIIGTKQLLKNYIESFNTVRDLRLNDYDSQLAKALGIEVS